MVDYDMHGDSMKRRRDFDIGRTGHPLRDGAEDLMTCPKVEMTEGRLFNSDEDRLYVLALILESVGVDRAVRLGDPRIWREAIDNLECCA